MLGLSGLLPSACAHRSAAVATPPPYLAQPPQSGHTPLVAHHLATMVPLERGSSTPRNAAGGTPLPQPAAGGALSPAPARSGAPAPATQPSQPEARFPVPAAQPTPPLRKPHDPPQIVTISVNPMTVSAGETVHGTALTSSNVASVEARLQDLPNNAQFAANMDRIGVGRFRIAYPIPQLPAFAHGTYTVLVIARNVDGVQATRTIRLTLR
jgi:hypothetical protein